MTVHAETAGARAGAAFAVLTGLAALWACAPEARAQDARRKQEIIFAELPSRTVGDAPFEIAVKSTSGLPVLLEVLSGPAVLDGKKVRLTGTPGLVIIRASQGGDASFLPATEAERAFSVDPRPFAPRVISQPQAVLVTIGEAVTLRVEVSGQPPPSLKWRKDGLELTGASGRSLAIVSADLADSGDYDVVASNSLGTATSDRARVTVARRRQFITFQGISGATVGVPVALSASATSGLPVRFEVVSGPAVISGTSAAVQWPGAVVIEASQQGDATYDAAAPVTQSFLARAGPNGQQVP